ncbi:MAG: hypothetical protein IH899_04505 [Planctomycetes bacterium]|nr:hypothetical protein [Planctomycetota bacterium]
MSSLPSKRLVRPVIGWNERILQAQRYVSNYVTLSGSDAALFRQKKIPERLNAPLMLMMPVDRTAFSVAAPVVDRPIDPQIDNAVNC